MDSVEPAASAEATVAPDCHGAHVEVSAEKTSECCCDPLTITGGEGPKTQRADLVAAAPLNTPLTLTPLATSAPVRAQPPPPIDLGPPVYLATQRFRI